MPEPKRREWIDWQLIAELRSPLKPGDSELRWILVALLLADLVAAAVVTVLGHGEELMVIGSWVAVTAAGGVVMVRIQRYGPGWNWFIITLLVFLGWNWGIVLGVVTRSGLAVGHRRLAWVVTEAVGALPLVFTITLLTIKLSKLRIATRSGRGAGE